MKIGTVYVVSRNGLGQAPEDLQRVLAVNFFGLSVDSELSPETILFYADGVKRARQGIRRRRKPSRLGEERDPGRPGVKHASTISDSWTRWRLDRWGK